MRKGREDWGTESFEARVLWAHFEARQLQTWQMGRGDQFICHISFIGPGVSRCFSSQGERRGGAESLTR